MLLVKRLPCLLSASRDPVIRLAFATVTPCRGRVEADHAGRRGVSRKSADDTTIPLCFGHHHERTNLYGSFKDWQAPAMRLWCDAAIVTTRAEVSELCQTDLLSVSDIGVLDVAHQCLDPGDEPSPDESLHRSGRCSR